MEPCLATQPWESVQPDEEHLIVLTDNEKYQIQRIVEELQEVHNWAMDDEELFLQIALACKHLPERILIKLLNFRRRSNDYGTLLFRNLPVDPCLPPTPQQGVPNVAKGTRYSEYCLLLFMMNLGEPIAYEDEKEGDIIQNICPAGGEEYHQENTGSVAFLEFHTEDGFHPFKPDYLGLFCLRSDHAQVAKTLTASIRRAIRLIPSKTLSVLRMPLYRIRLSASFLRGNGPPLYSAPLAILSGDLFEPDLCIDFYAMEAENSAAQKALECIKQALTQVITGSVLTAGDMTIVDNRVAAHARSSFKPKYDGEDRWVQRLSVVEDFRRSSGSRCRGKRVCTSLPIELFNG
jgi:L-asparagine oxygenase